MNRDELIALAKQTAQAAGVCPELLCAAIEQESDWDPWAVRFEPEFFKRYCVPLFTNNKITLTEAYLRAFSWGLGQVMGQTAREHGYNTELPRLCAEPGTNIELACKILAHKLAVNGGNERQALLAYNGGGRPAYADEVLARTGKYRAASLSDGQA